MNTNVNLEAAIGVLAFLGTAFVFGVAALVFLHALKTRSRTRGNQPLKPNSPRSLAVRN